MAENFREKYDKFRETYGIGCSFEELERTKLKFKALDSVLLGKKFKNTPRAKYFGTMETLLQIYIDSKVKIGEKKSYNTGDINLVKFVREYEDMMAQKYKEDGETRNRSYLEGIKPKVLSEAISQTFDSYRGDITDIWAERIANSTMSLTEMRRVTDADHNNYIRQQEGYTNSLANIVAARDAMQKIVDTKGLGWKIGNLVRFIRINSYLKDLNAKIAEYDNPEAVQEAQNRISKSVLSAPLNNLKVNMEKVQQLQEEKARNAENTKDENRLDVSVNNSGRESLIIPIEHIEPQTTTEIKQPEVNEVKPLENQRGLN